MKVDLFALQLNSSVDVLSNCQTVETMLAETVSGSQHKLVVLPEAWACFGGRDGENVGLMEKQSDGFIQDFMSRMASQHQIWLVGGTIPVKADNGRYFAACQVYNPQGELIVQYNKIHLFDVTVADGTGEYKESKHTQAGKDIVVFDTPFGRVGLAVCYDLRFPELFRLMQAQGLDLICLPSAFTKVTGQAHWQTLLQARAIENQCYVLAANQTGKHNGKETWGHSMLIDAWGTLTSSLGHEVAILQTEVDLTSAQSLRLDMPNLKHRRIKVSTDL